MQNPPSNVGMFYLVIKPKRVNIPKLTELPKTNKESNNNESLPSDVGYIFQSKEEVSR